jgi:hypothetical protein
LKVWPAGSCPRTATRLSQRLSAPFDHSSSTGS